ncbi:NUDIX hydrolase [Clostridium polyendosporum]|uniref:8-oxo-dGTP diphosphatase n=1 Tax=Clostridium polyendosporum TaxID=69208 RepID=A0A919VCV5_9CLOT|nr:(deoxy)nucleoside triphosphate pyrophosphohydrolase [Clostridium polyendosporum]GIM27344.1 NUDIX hydrolase [Clostridium polyendosporum]
MKNVTAAVIIKNNKILICQRSLSDKLSGKWEFPGGKIEEGELPEECLIREIKEELDIHIEVGEKLGENIYDYSYDSINLIAYFATWKSGDIKLNVHNDYKWVTKDDIKEYDFAEADVPFVKKLIDQGY